MRRTGKLKLCAYLSCWLGQGWKLHWRAWQPGLLCEDRDKNPSSRLLSPVERALAIVGRGAWRLGKVARRSPKNVNWLIKDVNINDKVNKWERVNEPTRAAALWNSSLNSKIASGWILSSFIGSEHPVLWVAIKMISGFVFHLTETGLWTEDCGCCCCTGR